MFTGITLSIGCGDQRMAIKNAEIKEYPINVIQSKSKSKIQVLNHLWNDLSECF